MINELKKIEHLLWETNQSHISNVVEDLASKAYLGYQFESNAQTFIFRKSKITPKKNGQFVTLWKRNANNESEPYCDNDDVDFYMILSQENEQWGIFLFPKNELIKRHILSTKLKEGKRGFRVYPKWTKPENKQAEKTQTWQNNYFLDFTIEQKDTLMRLAAIIKKAL